MGKVSLDNIAKSLGVSKTLVSMVINGKGDLIGISKKTQKAVMDKVAEMNYHPNQFARSLRMGKSNVIGLIVADISNTFYAKMARYFEDLANRKNYNLIICSSDENEEKEHKLIEMLTNKQVDGLVISSTVRKTDVFQKMKKERFPFVLVDRNFPRFKANYVGVDNYQGAFDATKHLIDAGYSDIGFMTITPSHLSTLKDRFMGYKAALNEHSIKYNGKIVREIRFENVARETEEILAELSLYKAHKKALFVANNNLAISTLIAMKKMKLSCPEDVALVSFDDIELFKFTPATVTAVSQPLFNICQIAFDILYSRIANKDLIMEFEQTILPTSLIVRESCGFKQ
jgi:LacI family transcriptional regulator